VILIFNKLRLFVCFVCTFEREITQRVLAVADVKYASNYGQEHPLQSVFSQRNIMEILGAHVGDLRFSDIRKDQGKASI